MVFHVQHVIIIFNKEMYVFLAISLKNFVNIPLRVTACKSSNESESSMIIYQKKQKKNTNEMQIKRFGCKKKLSQNSVFVSNAHTIVIMNFKIHLFILFAFVLAISSLILLHA